MANLIPAEAEAIAPRTAPVDFSAVFDTSVLEGRSVFITGGASGIGLASATAFALKGAFVTIGDISDEAGKAEASKLTSQGLKVNFIHCDVTDYESQYAAFKSALAFGNNTLDIVIANAGIIAQKSLTEQIAQHEFDPHAIPPPPGMSGLDVNLKGVYFTSYLALHFFRAPPPPNTPPFKKSIVMVASSAGYAGYPYSATYAMSKFGVRGLFYGTRDSAARFNPAVRVNLIAPWFIKTAMTTGDSADHPTFDTFGFAPIELVSDAIVRLGGDEEIRGRAVLNMPEGNYDLGDNVWEGFGGVVARERMGARFKDILEKRRKLEEAKAKAAEGGKL
jgi:5'-hydroxyaverantin dehydrogenase